MRFDQFVEQALYDPETGFYATGGAAGRRGDFITSVEVGPLFGAVLGRALDTWWAELGRPDPFVVVDAGAGAGMLGRTVEMAAPHRWLNVERSAALRAAHAVGESLADLPTEPFAGVIVANELLDNLPFRLLVGDRDVCVGDELPDVGCWPLQEQAATWVERALALLRPGRLVVLDYCSTTAEMAAQPWREWLRTYRGHAHGSHPWDRPGSQDITCEVAVDQLPPPTQQRSQAEFLRAHGIDDLVAEGREVWTERAAIGDLEALRARSRINEAAALLDLATLGGFTVLEWVVGDA